MKDGVKGVTGVAALQRLLSGVNALKEDYAPGQVDGEFGELTEKAVYRAKWWAGYAKRNCNGSAGEVIQAILRGHRKLTVAQRRRRAQRLKARGKETLAERALKIHLSHVGETESPPNSNRSWASRLYGLVGAWCMMAVSTSGKLAGSRVFKLFREGNRWAYVPYFEAAARQGLYFLAVIRPQDLKRGNIVTMDWDGFHYGRGGGTGDHVEHFIEWVDYDAGLMRTVGSNTSFEGAAGSQSDGGATAIRTRRLADVNYCVRWSERR